MLEKPSPLDPSIVNDLVKRWQNNRDERARDELVRRFMPVIKSAARFWGSQYRADRDDADQLASLGFLRAIETYDPAKGSLATYTSQWARGKISLARARTLMISVPAHTLDHGSRVARASFKLRRRLGRNPTEQELASATGLSARAVKTACGVSTLRGRMVSISAPISNREGSLTLGDVIEADEGERPDVIVANAIDAAAAREAIDAAVATFVPRHREVVRLRLIDGLTLEEAGDRMGVTRERVRQIEMTAARRLRTALANHPAVLGILGRTPLLEERDDEDDSALLSAKDLRARTGLAAADLTERISRGEFPPHALRDRRGQRLWRESAVERWQA